MRYLISILIILFAGIGCSKKSNPDEVLVVSIEKFLPYSPDSAFQFLESNREFIVSRKDRAYAELMEYYRLDLKGYNFYVESQVIDIMNNSHLYTANSARALLLYYKGNFLMRRNEFGKANELFHSSIELANKIQWYNLLGMIYHKSAEMFYELGLYKTSIEYADEAIQSFTIARDDISINRALAYKIFSLYELGELQEGWNLYQIAKEKASNMGDINYINHLCSELISILLLFDDPEKAGEFYKDIKTYNKEGMLPIEYLYLGNTYTLKQQLDSAYYYLAQIDQKNLLNYDRILYNSLFSDFYKQKKEYKNALDFMEKNLALRDTIITYGQRASLVKIESRFQNLKTLLLYEKEIAERERIVYWISTIFFIFLIIAIVYRNKTKKQKEEMNNRIAIISEIVSGLKESNQTLLTKLDIHKEKENLLKEQIERKLGYAKLFSDLYYKYPNKPATILKKMDEMFDLVPTNKEFTSEIISNVNLYYNNAIYKLTQKHTDLTHTEILFLALLIAGFSVHEMSLILNSNSLDAVYTRKYRLKQKLFIHKNMDIEDYLATYVEN